MASSAVDYDGLTPKGEIAMTPHTYGGWINPPEVTVRRRSSSIPVMIACKRCFMYFS